MRDVVLNISDVWGLVCICLPTSDTGRVSDECSCCCEMSCWVVEGPMSCGSDSGGFSFKLLVAVDGMAVAVDAVADHGGRGLPSFMSVGTRMVSVMGA